MIGKGIFNPTDTSEGGELGKKMVADKQCWETSGKLDQYGELHEEPADLLDRSIQITI